MDRRQRAVDEIIRYGLKLSAQHIRKASYGGISCRIDETSFACSRTGADFNSLTKDDIEVVGMSHNGQYKLLGDIYKSYPKLNAVIISSTAETLKVAKGSSPVVAALDDMAQIIGWDAKVAAYEGNSSRIISSFRGRLGCIMSDTGMITAGRSLEEAYTAALVLDKSSKVMVYAPKIGGIRPVGRLSYIIEHSIYQRKYSKINDQFLEQGKGECSHE